jgi:hypothetical protein
MVKEELDDWSDVAKEMSQPQDSSVPCLDSDVMEAFVCWTLGKQYLERDEDYLSALSAYGKSKGEIADVVYRHLHGCVACCNAHEEARDFYQNLRQSLAPKGGKPR